MSNARNRIDRLERRGETGPAQHMAVVRDRRGREWIASRYPTLGPQGPRYVPASEGLEVPEGRRLVLHRLEADADLVDVRVLYRDDAPHVVILRRVDRKAERVTDRWQVDPPDFEWNPLTLVDERYATAPADPEAPEWVGVSA